MTTLTDASTRQPPWDAMGSQLTVKATTVAAALKESGLDFTTEVRAAWSGHRQVDPAASDAEKKGAQRKAVKGATHQAIVRPMPDGSEKVLAFTGRRYTPIQNRDAFAVADHLVAEFGAAIQGAADYRNGDRSLLAVKLPHTINLVRPDGGSDPVDLSLVITNDHAGNGSLNLALTPIRLECTNALPAAMRDAERVWKIRHTPNAMVRLDLARDAILKSLEYRDAFQEQAQAMLDAEMVDAEFRKMVAKLYPVKRDAEGVAADRRRAVQADLLQLWKESPTLEGVRGTRWAGYNVVTEYLDHYRPVRSTPEVARAEGALDGHYTRQKANLWGMFAAA